MMDETEAGKTGNCGEPVLECCENRQQKCLISVTSTTAVTTEIKENCNPLQLSYNSKQKEQPEGQAFIKGTNKPNCSIQYSSGFLSALASESAIQERKGQLHQGTG